MAENQGTQGDRAVDFLTFFRGCDSVRVPRLQRAYAQGRLDAKLVRDNFLRDVFDALAANRVLELNFVYGAKANGVFDLLDGQQRLTTLFLLHWYCANAELSEIPAELAKLAYETRPTSKDFVADLTRRKIALGGKPPSSAISGMRWYSCAYRNDPTVAAMLIMLDAIHEKYLGQADRDLYGKLTLLRFYRLALDDFRRTDELYIKMNARGLPLTPFENFKADLVDHLQKLAAGPMTQDVSFKGRTMKGWQRFLAKIDTDWTAYFWQKGDDCVLSDRTLSFKLFRVFIRQLLYRYLTCDANVTDAQLKDDPVVLFLDEDAENKQEEVYLGFSAFKYVLDRDPEALSSLERLLDGLCSEHLDVSALDRLLKSPFGDTIERSWVGERKSLLRTHLIAISSAMAYLECQKAYDGTNFSRWMRVVWNAISNTNIDGIRPQIALTRDLVSLTRKPGLTENVYATLAALPAGTYRRSIEEELLKSRLIARDPALSDEWERELITGERTAFNRGMLGFYLDENMTIAQFMHRRDNVALLFDGDGISAAFRNHHVLIRAMVAQMRTWQGGLKDKSITESTHTKDTHLKNLLAGSAAIRALFCRITDMPGAAEMMAALSAACAQADVFDDGSSDQLGRAMAQTVFNRLVTSEKLYDWLDAVEREKGSPQVRKSLFLEWRYGHYMLNAPRAWGAARVILDTDRETMIPLLVQEFGLAYAETEQAEELDRYGFYTTYAVEVFKMERGGRFAVKFGLDHKIEISYRGKVVCPNVRYGLLDTYQVVKTAVTQELAKIGVQPVVAN